MTDELPQGWSFACLETFCSFQSGGRLKLTKKDYLGEGIPAFSAAGQDGFVGPCEFELPAVVVSSIGARCGKAFKAEGSWTSLANTYLVFPSREVCDLTFLWYQLNDERSWERSGSAQPFIKPSSIQERVVRIAPLREQRRIVSKIDELFSRIDEGERALERVQKLVERYRQSVLKAAVTGELTRDWRERNKDQLESGEALLARILKARREAWEKAELDKMKAKGITPANDKWKQKYEEPVAPDTSRLPELPHGWVWASLDQLCSLITSGSRGWSEHYAESGSLFIRAQNIKRDVLDLSDVAFVDLAGVTEGIRTKVLQHDLLVTITGANVTKSALVTVNLDNAFVSQHVALIRPVQSSLSPFLFQWVVSPANGRASLLAAAYGAGKPGLSLENLKELSIALPPQAEQDAICELLEIDLARISHIASDSEERARGVSQLRQAILKSAFAGTLVEQHSTDESASYLLDRIAAEHSKAPAKPKRGRKPKTSERA